MEVKAKKHLGQHFLICKNTAEKIADALETSCEKVLEIGAGTGMLTQFLLAKKYTTYAVEIDKESIDFLKKKYPDLKEKIIAQDILKMNLKDFFKGENFAIIGNFPYHIASQIIFKILENKEYIPEVVGMFQKEVAQRITANHGNKIYGILSVLTQIFYETEYLFNVPPLVFNPPPKVDSAVIRLKRKKIFPEVDEIFLRKMVKIAFGQRRKKMSNSLKSLPINKGILKNEIFSKRPEQLSITAFIKLSKNLKNAIKTQ